MTQPTPEQNEEIQFKVDIEPVIRKMMDNLEEDSSQFGVSPALFQRAVWTWAMSRLLRNAIEPSWFIPELDRLQREAG